MTSQDSLDVMIPPDMVVRDADEEEQARHNAVNISRYQREQVEDLITVEDDDYGHHEEYHDAEEQEDQGGFGAVGADSHHDGGEEEDDALSCSCVAGDMIDGDHRDRHSDRDIDQRQLRPRRGRPYIPHHRGNNNDGSSCCSRDEQDGEDALSCQGVAGDDGSLCAVRGEEEEELAYQAEVNNSERERDFEGCVGGTGRRRTKEMLEPPEAGVKAEEDIHRVADEGELGNVGPQAHAQVEYPYLAQNGVGSPNRRLDDSGILEDRSEPRPPAITSNQAVPKSFNRPNHLLVQQQDEKPRSSRNDEQLYHIPGNGVVREEGLNFDLREPWQRSLLREMQKKNSKAAAASASAATPASGTASTTASTNNAPNVPTLMQMHQQNRNLADPVLVGVGHTESRDFAVEYPDDLTLATDTSSTMPIRSQAIHRPWIYPDESAGALYTEDAEEVLQYSGAEPTDSKLNYNDDPAAGGVGVQNPHLEDELKRRRRLSNANDGDPTRTPRPLREQRDVGSSIPTPPTSPLHRETELQMMAQQPKRNNYQHQQDPNNAPWLEMEPSDLDDNCDDNATVNTATITSGATPGDACFCMGYNVLDVMVGPTTSSSASNSKYRGSKSSRRLHLHQRRISHTPLGRVDEVSHEDYAQATKATSAAAVAVANAHHYSSSVSATAKHHDAGHDIPIAADPHPRLDRKLSRDPDGAYHDQYQYYLQHS